MVHELVHHPPETLSLGRRNPLQSDPLLVEPQQVGDGLHPLEKLHLALVAGDVVAVTNGTSRDHDTINTLCKDGQNK